MIGALTHQSAGTRMIVNMIHLLAYIYEHQPTRDEVCAHFDISIATFKRQIAAARYFGVDVRTVMPKGSIAYYAIRSFGLFKKSELLEFSASA